jgi:hypothetical protein
VQKVQGGPQNKTVFSLLIVFLGISHEAAVEEKFPRHGARND